MIFHLRLLIEPVTTQCKYPISEVIVKVVAEPDTNNKSGSLSCARVLQRHCPFSVTRSGTWYRSLTKYPWKQAKHRQIILT